MMIAQQAGERPLPKCTANILPCKIQSDGPVNASTRYWHPERNEGDFVFLIVDPLRSPFTDTEISVGRDEDKMER